MKIVINKGTTVTGDGKTVLHDASLIISGNTITKVAEASLSKQELQDVDRVIEAAGKIIIPGLINSHAHRVTLAPAGAYGAPHLPRERVITNLNTHLLQGTTTILSVDGFATMEDVEAINRSHPVNIKTGTIHSPINLKAAKQADGSGLEPRHERMTIKKMLDAGAVIVGELGAGGTLGGGSQDWLYIPKAIKEKTGREITPRQARALKEAVLGRYIKPSIFDVGKVKQALEEAGLTKALSIEEAKELIENSVLPPFDFALDGLREGIILAEQYGVPAVVHTAAASVKMLLECAQEHRFVADHTNHPSFTVTETLETARTFKEHGVSVSIATLDTFGAQNLSTSPDNTFALLEADLVDTISTDYGGGHHDAILLQLQKAIEAKVIDLPKAVALATYNATLIIPKLAPQRGLIAEGKVADIVLVNENDISKVDTVIIGGKVVVEKDQQGCLKIVDYDTLTI